MKRTCNKIIVVIIGIILNVVGRFLAQSLNLPIWFDMVGTCIATYFSGLWGGIITGVFHSMISGLFDTTAFLYSLTAVVATVLLHVFIKKGFWNNPLRTAISSFWIGILCTVVSTPLNLIFYDGYSGNLWGDTLVDMLRWHDVSDVLAALAGEAIVEIVDKQICVMLGYIIIYIAKRLQERKSAAVKVAALTLAAGTAICAVGQPITVLAADKSFLEEYFIETIYNNANGMVSSEANTICETEDGYIWIGSYAGLTKYDGNKFEFVREGGLVNVVGMMNDSRGRLWIGTNDAGIARYEAGEYTYFTIEDGLPANSIRCFTEDKNGNVYVGTSDRICRFNTDDTIDILEQDITFVKAMVVYNDMLVVMDNNGDIYALNGEVVLRIVDKKAEKLFYYCLAVTSQGLMAGTDTGELFIFDIAEEGLHVKEEINVSANEITAVFEDSKGLIWGATESGFGYMDSERQYHKMYYKEFESSIDNIYEDYQGNIWLASSRYGVMKLSESQFVNLFEKADINGAVVNAVTYYKGAYYCGTDKGLVVLDEKSLRGKTNKLTVMTAGSRVRSLLTDSENRLWVCTYNGLICYTAEGDIRCYNMETDNTTSDRFRCITELTDGSFAAGTADGINFIKNGKLTGSLTARDGLANTQILSIVEGIDNRVWAGSDGSGIYVIEDGKLVENYTVDNGLSSNVILRIVPHEDGYLVVTSNALCHIDLDGKVRKLSQFPYFNNYDVIIDESVAYIPCSAGLYKAEISELCADSEMQFRLYGASDGLLSGLTANSWNYLAKDGRLYLCGNNGVTVFNSNEAHDTSLKYGIASVECDGEEIGRNDDGEYMLPSMARNISIYGSVKNYAFTDARVRFYVKELDDNPKLYAWNEIEPIQIFKPDFTEYHVCFQVLDSTGEDVLQEKLFTIGREKRVWEENWYIAYLIIVTAEILLFTIISIVSMILFAIRKNELEEQQIELEKKVNEKTEELSLQQNKTKKLFVQTVTALSEAVDAKDRYTSGHSKRVAEYAQMIAQRMGKSKEEQEEIHRAGLLHDVGKIRIPVDIINKSGKLTEEEFRTIKIHPVTGYHILRGISDSDVIAIGAKYHHERYDGKGYPNGLSGENIPEVARILGVADSYDAMTSNRSYRQALPQDVVRSEIEKGRGTQFDPAIADIMLQMIDEDKDYTMKQTDSMHRSVLVVDDQPMSIKFVEHIMRDEPMYKIVAVTGGREALELMERQAFDLILLDVNMPDMDGLETLKRIREKHQTPVALMTGDKSLDTMAVFAELGCDDYITKPFQPLLLKEVVHNMTERTVIGDL